MSTSLATHDRVVRQAIAEHAGYVFSTGGDGFGVAFGRASSAIAAAESAQSRLSDIDWGAGPQLEVRMGLHLGEAEERHGDYFGPPVNIAARVQAAAHGGQVALTDLVRSAAGVEGNTKDLGLVQLRDVPEPLQVYQLGDLEFPALRSAGAIESTVPGRRTSLIGRQEDLREIRGLLAAHRLVTLTGIGGAGKTRLAVEVATRELDEGTDAAFFVDLSPVRNESEVGPAFASGMNFIPSSSSPVAQQVRARLGTRAALLIVDNCEHVVDEVANQVDELLAGCPNVVLLATSREPLDLHGEVVVRIGPLSTQATPNESSAAVQLFRQRAVDSGSSLALTSDVERMISEICVRLDGIPLAIELAAARTTALTPEQIVQRLDDRFALLATRRRRATARQQTLKATIAWSYDLLARDEQQLLDHLSVFPATFDLPAIEAVSPLAPARALPLIESLIEKSLVQPGPPSDQWTMARYRLLETVRAFGHDRLEAEPGAVAAARLRYARHIAERIGTEAGWPFAPLTPALEVLADDLIPAIEYADDAGEHALVAQLAVDAFPLWALRGQQAEAERWLLATEPHLGTRDLSRSLSGRWSLAHWLPARADQAVGLAEKGLAVHPVEDQPWVWFSLLGAGIGRYINHPVETTAIMERARSSVEWANHPQGATEALDWLQGLISLWQGSFGDAVTHYGVDRGLNHDDLLLAPFRLAGTFYANYLGGTHDANRRLLDDPNIITARRHWFDYAQRGSQNVLSVEIAASVAHAGLGEHEASMTTIREAYAQLGQSPWPRLPPEFLLGLSAVQISRQDVLKAERLLDLFVLGRYPESQPLGYHLIARAAGWEHDDWPETARQELRRRLRTYSEQQSDRDALRAIEAEFADAVTTPTGSAPA